MGILLGFLPFVVFALTSGLLGPTTGLLLGAATSAVLLARSRVKGESPKILESGTLVLFLALAIYSSVASHPLSMLGVRLCVDTGLFAIVLLSVLARRPFTLQYAREQVPRELWENPLFVRTNYVLSGAWVVAFFVIVVAEAALVFVPGAPEKAGIAIVICALAGGVGFTTWYSKREKKHPAPTTQSKEIS